MKVIKVQDAVGQKLSHDLTRIVPGEFKGPAFRKGHIIKEEDIPVLLSMGKEHVYVWEDIEGILHENDAAVRLKDMTCGEGLYFGEIKEGKIEFFATYDGLLKIDVDTLLRINSLGEIIISTKYNNTVVKKGDKVGATKIIPLTIEEEKIKQAEKIATNKIIKIVPIDKKKTAIITTGSEVYNGLIKDGFYPVLKEKLSYYQCEILGQTILPDDQAKIESTIEEWLQKGAELILCTGGMSVDADDVTPKAIKNVSDKITYGSPILPGAMVVVSYKKNIPILGLPANVIFAKKTAFDIILPRVLANEILELKDIAEYGHGGLI